jgi:hypothetical protein
MHRTRNSFAAIPLGDDPSWPVLFSLNILAPPSAASLQLSSAATELGSKMVADCSGFVSRRGWGGPALFQAHPS